MKACAGCGEACTVLLDMCRDETSDTRSGPLVVGSAAIAADLGTLPVHFKEPVMAGDVCSIFGIRCAGCLLLSRLVSLWCSICLTFRTPTFISL